MTAPRAIVLIALLLLSCSKETTKPKVQQQPQLVTNDTPEHAVLRFLGAYERKATSEYADMFTGDFTFEFSNSTDPELVTKYHTGWWKTDEDTCARHLFIGFTPQGEPLRPAASSVNIDLAATKPVDDHSTGVDPVTHKLLATRVDGQVTVPPTSPETDPVNFLIENNFHALYLVRGDFAAELTLSQPADDAHWYIYRWVDMTAATAPLRSPQPTTAKTWSALKAAYR